MSVFFNRVDPAPLAEEKFSDAFNTWLSNLVDQINETLNQAQEVANNIKIDKTADIGGAGAGPISVSVSGMSADSIIVATIASSTNTVAVAKCVGTASGFDITFTGDPGASCIVNYSVGIATQ